MRKEINLLLNYPKSKRNINKRQKNKSQQDISIARKFDREFFDGDRNQGYGGFSYNPKYWQPVIFDFIKYYNLTKYSDILDVGCAKGFMLHDFKKVFKDINVQGIDISEYAINNSMNSVKENLKVGNATDLEFEDDSFDLVISITTIHNLELKECIKALKEIQRVSRKDSFITVDAYSNEEEKKNILNWNLTAKTILHVDDWLNLFDKAGYRGDYYWFMP